MSPDGTRVALSIRDAQDEIWVWDLARETLTRATISTAGPAQYPAWTPDSRRLLFGSLGSIFRLSADGSGVPERLTPEKFPGSPMPYAVTPDGGRLIVREGATSYDLGLLSLDSNRRIEPLIRTVFSELNAEISPDGRWLAYESNESGQREVYVRPFPDVTGGRWLISKSGGTRPLWSHSGRELFYVAPVDNGLTLALITVPVASGTEWKAGSPTKLFEGKYFHSPAGVGEGRTYDLAADDRRFLMIKDVDEGAGAGQNNVVIVQHFDSELKRLAAVK
jgi:serine/threonine-protein kinase